MNTSPLSAAVPTAALLDPVAWADATFGRLELGDARRSRRLPAIAERLAAQPAASLPAAVADPALLKAAYRLLHAAFVS